jgi:GT2 family glycosyltransferase
MDSKSVTVIIPNYNGIEVLPDCLLSLEKQVFRDFRVMVIDNCSHDGSAPFIKKEFPTIDVIELPANRGFGAAINEGLRRAGSPFIAILNNDAVADPYWLDELRRKLEKDRSIHFCSCKVLNYFRKSYICELGQIYCTDGSIVQLGAGLKDNGNLDLIIQEVFGPTGAAAFYRREMLDDLGGFDEDFFLYYEDVDLNFRAQLWGYKCHYIPTSVVYHRGGHTTCKVPHMHRFLIQNKIGVMIKNLPSDLFWKNSEKICRGLREDYELLKAHGEEESFHQGLKGVIGSYERLLEKRRDILQKRKVSDTGLEKIIMERDEIKALSNQGRLPFLNSRANQS